MCTSRPRPPRVRVRHQPRFVLPRRGNAAVVHRDRLPVDVELLEQGAGRPVLFRVLYGAGLWVSEALNLLLPDVDTTAATLRISDSKNVAATLDAQIAAAHPSPGTQRPRVLQQRAGGRPIDQSTVHLRFRGYLADADIPHFIPAVIPAPPPDLAGAWLTSSAKRTSGGIPTAGRGGDGQGVCRTPTFQMDSFATNCGKKP